MTIIRVFIVSSVLLLVGCNAKMISVDALGPSFDIIVNDYEAYTKTGKKPDGSDMSDAAVQERLGMVKDLRRVMDKARGTYVEPVESDVPHE